MPAANRGFAVQKIALGKRLYYGPPKVGLASLLIGCAAVRQTRQGTSL